MSCHHDNRTIYVVNTNCSEICAYIGWGAREAVWGHVMGTEGRSEDEQDGQRRAALASAMGS